MSKGVVLGGYQISNVLVAILLVASTTGAGVATDSFSGISEGFDNPLSGPSENVTDVNNTDDTDDSDGQDTDNSDSSDSDGSDSSDSDDSQDSSDSSDDDGGFLDDILGDDEEQNNEENDTDDTVDNVDDSENVTEGDENDTGLQNDTTTVEIASFSAPRDSQFYDPYESTSVPLQAELSGENAQYEVVLNGETYTTGSFSGTETINTTLTLSNTGTHEITLKLTQSGTTANSITRTFEISDSAIQETGFSKTTTIRTGAEAGFRLLENGEPVQDASISLDGTQTTTTNADGEFTIQVPYQETITLSTDRSGIQEETFNVTQEIPEPSITLVNPIDTASFDTPTGTNRDVTFEADVEITEDSGTASVMIDGSEAYTQDISSGTNSISTTQALAGGTHNWQVDVDTPEYNVSSSSRSLTVNEQDVPNGISLQNNATAGEYNYVRLYDSGEPVEGTEITVNGDSIGATDSNGEAGFEVPNAQEITVSASGYDSITQSVEGYTEEIDMAFSFSDTIYQGRSNTLTVTDQESGDALSDATVYVNGVEQEGQTDSSGQITFTVPEENSVTVKAVKDNSDDNRSFTADVPPVDITWFGPEDGASINDYEAEFDFSLDLQESATATLDVEGQQQLQQDLSSGSHSITEQVKFENSGTRDYTLTVDSSSETRTETGSFTTEQDMPSIEINIDNPTDGETIDDYKTTIEYGFDSPEDFNYSTKIDGRTLESLDLLEGQGNSVNTNVRCLESGTHSLFIEAYAKETETSVSEEIEFTTTSEMPIADLILQSPEEGESLDTFFPRFDIKACVPDVDYSVSALTDGSVVTTTHQGSLDKYQKVQNFKISEDIEPGPYEALISATKDSKSVNVSNDFVVE